MATITLSMPKELERMKEKFPEIDWNEVIKRGILKRLDEFKRIVSKSKLTEKDALELGRAVKKSLHERYKKLYKKLQ